MPKLILRCNYLKNAPPSHLENFMTYIGTRDGVEKVESTTANLPPTARQEDLIQDILRKIPDADRMHEYYDYLQRPTRENASEFITQALENNLDIIAKKKNYMDYLANRPGVERTGTHGLFSNEGEPIVLSRVADEVANHTGVVWTNVISLRREDAERLGYDSAAQWQALLRSRVELLCENYKTDSRNLKWYEILHLINLLGTDNEWRDERGKKEAPTYAESLHVKYYTEKEITQASMASFPLRVA